MTKNRRNCHSRYNPIRIFLEEYTASLSLDIVDLLLGSRLASYQYAYLALHNSPADAAPLVRPWLHLS